MAERAHSALHIEFPIVIRYCSLYFLSKNILCTSCAGSMVGPNSLLLRAHSALHFEFDPSNKVLKFIFPVEEYNYYVLHVQGLWWAQIVSYIMYYNSTQTYTRGMLQH